MLNPNVRATRSMREDTKQALLEDCYNTVWAIAASPLCQEFIVGYTHQPARTRARQYYDAVKLGYQHFVVLADRMGQADAVWLERELQTRVKQNLDEVEPLRKYRAERAADVYRASTGGVTLPPEAAHCSVYMAWLEPVDQFEEG